MRAATAARRVAGPVASPNRYPYLTGPSTDYTDDHRPHQSHGDFIAIRHAPIRAGCIRGAPPAHSHAQIQPCRHADADKNHRDGQPIRVSDSDQDP